MANLRLVVHVTAEQAAAMSDEDLGRHITDWEDDIERMTQSLIEYGVALDTVQKERLRRQRDRLLEQRETAVAAGDSKTLGSINRQLAELGLTVKQVATM